MDLSKSQLRAIFKQLGEYLPEDEEIEYASVARNASNTLYIKPALLATDYRVIFVEPKYWGIKAKARSYTYEEIADVHLERGWFTHKLSINPYPGLGPAMVQDYLEKKRSEAMYDFLLERISQNTAPPAPNSAYQPYRPQDDDSNVDKLGQLAELLQQGLISPQEYQNKKDEVLSTFAADQAVDSVEKLQRLGRYLEERLITETDFARAKSLILASL